MTTLKIKKFFSVTIDLIYQVILMAFLLIASFFLVKSFDIEFASISIEDYLDNQEYTDERQNDISSAKRRMDFLSKKTIRDVKYYKGHEKDLGDIYSEYLHAYSLVEGEFSHYFGSRLRYRSSEVQYALDLYSLAEALQNNYRNWGSSLNGEKQKTSPYEEIPFILQDIKHMRDSYVNAAKEGSLFYEERRYDLLKRMFVCVAMWVCSIVLGRLVFIWGRRRENDEA